MATTYQGYALLIGVNKYSSYSQSVKAAPGAHGLSGSLNDLRAWWDVARGAGIPARNIRVLSTRRMRPGELETGANGVSMGLATREEILDGVTWLAKNAAKDRTQTAMLVFAGHGDFVEGEGLALCPSDVTGPKVQGAVTLKAIRGVLTQHAGNQPVLAFLDCSFGGPVDPSVAHGVANGRSLTGRALPEDLDLTLLRSIDKVVTPDELGTVAYELPSRHGWHGPLSLEALAILDHWAHGTRGADGEVERRQAHDDAASGLLDLVHEAGLRDCAPCVDKCSSGSGGTKSSPRGDTEEGDGSELSGSILGFRSIEIIAMLAGGGTQQVGLVNIDTSVSGVHTENWFLNTAGAFDNPLEFRISYDGKHPPAGMSGPDVISWSVVYDDSLWQPAGGKVIPATNPAANLRTYFRNGSPISTTNKWFTLELPVPGADGKITWWSAYASQAGLLFSDTSKVGDTIRYNVYNTNRNLNSNGRFLVEFMS